MIDLNGGEIRSQYMYARFRVEEDGLLLKLIPCGIKQSQFMMYQLSKWIMERREAEKRGWGAEVLRKLPLKREKLKEW